MSDGVEVLSAVLDGALSVDPTARDDLAAEETVVTPSRQQLYKNESRLQESQEARRRRLLLRQKEQRDRRLDRLRAVAADETDDEADMDTAAARPGYRRPPQYNSRYRNQMMFSEYMEQAPADLETSWVYKICPRGRRCLVVARRKTTRCYSAAGLLLQSFPSLLPGGSRHSDRKRPTLLDCHWDRTAGVFHVLDVLSWNGQDVIDCDVEFRFTWLTWKMAETPRVAVKSRVNPFIFVPIPEKPASVAALQANVGQLASADGVLFFHRAGHYQCGGTPLVLWLRSFMLPEVVGLALTPAELGAPDDYTDKEQYIAAAEERRRQRRTNRPQHMQLCSGESEHDSAREQTQVETAEGDAHVYGREMEGAAGGCEEERRTAADMQADDADEEVHRGWTEETVFVPE